MPMSIDNAEFIVANAGSRIVVGSVAAELAGITSVKFYQSADVHLSVPDSKLRIAVTMACWDFARELEQVNVNMVSKITTHGEPIRILTSCPSGKVDPGELDSEFLEAVNLLSEQDAEHVAHTVKRLLDAAGGLTVINEAGWPEMAGKGLETVATTSRQSIKPMSTQNFGSLAFIAGRGEWVTAVQILISRQGGPEPLKGTNPFPILPDFTMNPEIARLLLPGEHEGLRLN
ncbi:hypothetical protein ACEUZ9_000961 [Paracoccus litorisediminis]|uniref:hypothetical protein n=1 Tax=Paracoccus litorisediminis TaxID=2006130 RepID=UPI003732EB59